MANEAMAYQEDIFEETINGNTVLMSPRPATEHNGVFGAPDLVVEVLSPSSITRDKGVKKDAYERAGVKEYWIVDPISQSIEVYHLREGRLALDHAYIIFPDWEWERMTEQEKAEAKLSVKVSLYDDLEVDIREVFEDIF